MPDPSRAAIAATEINVDRLNIEKPPLRPFRFHIIRWALTGRQLYMVQRQISTVAPGFATELRRPDAPDRSPDAASATSFYSALMLASLMIFAYFAISSSMYLAK
jgi:hypothetical protein